MKSHKKLFFWIIVIALAVMAVVYFTQRNKHATQTETYISSYSMEGPDLGGKFGIESSELSSQVLLQGTVCVENAATVSKIDLFMPDMGHGSSPPVVSRATKVPSSLKLKGNDYGCFSVSKMEMFMPGLWQVRVFYQNGDKGYFNVNLER